MKNIHVLPTNKPSRLWTNNLKRRLELDEFPSQHPTNIAKNIYITSDEEIKGGDYFTDDNNSLKRSYKLSHVQFANPKKIILTTDEDLIKDGVQAIDDEFLEWFVKNPSCEFVEVEGHIYKGQDETEYKIIIPKEEPKQEGYICPHTKIQCDDEYLKEELKKYEGIECIVLNKPEEPKQETLEEAKNNAWDNYEHVEGNLYSTSFKNGFEIGAKWQAERMYSEEDLREAFQVSLSLETQNRVKQLKK